jgi:PhnB protein
MKVQSYLMFNGHTEEALEFYKQALGAEVVMLMRFKEAPEQPPPGTLPPGSENKVMHACFRIGETELMASDGCTAEGAKFQGISLTLNPADEAEARRLYDALAAGGQAQMPLAKTFFSPAFGIVVDKFGVSWMVVVEQAAQAAAAA